MVHSIVLRDSYNIKSIKKKTIFLIICSLSFSRKRKQNKSQVQVNLPVHSNNDVFGELHNSI